MAKRPRLKLLSSGKMTPLEETRQLLALSNTADAFRQAVKHLHLEIITALNPINPHAADLTDNDRAIVFCLENQNNKDHKARLNFLQACVKVLEANTISARHVNLFIAAFIDVAQENDNDRKRSKGGSKEKILQGILAAVEKVLKKDSGMSAEKTWEYFKRRHNGSAHAMKIKGFRIYFTDTSKGELDEKLHQNATGKKPESIRRSAFGNYVKTAKKNLQASKLPV